MAVGETVKHQESMKQIKDSLPQWCDPHQAQVVANLKVWGNGLMYANSGNPTLHLHSIY